MSRKPSRKPDDPYEVFAAPAAAAATEAEAGAPTGATTLPEAGGAPPADAVPPPVTPTGLDRTLATGDELPRSPYKPAADPLLVESLEFLERVQAGGLLHPGAGQAYLVLQELINKLRREVRW